MISWSLVAQGRATRRPYKAVRATRHSGPYKAVRAFLMGASKALKVLKGRGLRP